MATITEIARGYADRVTAAIRSSGFEKYASAEIRKSLNFTEMAFGLELRQIAKDAATWKQQEEILTETGRLLGLPNPADFTYVVKSGSNDAFLRLVNLVLPPTPPKPKS